MSKRKNAFHPVVPKMLAAAALVVLPMASGCQSAPTHPGFPPPHGSKENGESLALTFGADATTKAAESNAPFIGQVYKDKQRFHFVLKGFPVTEGGASVDKPYTAVLTASQARIYLPGIISALFLGQYAVAETTTVDAYADGTDFAVVNDPTGATYVIHIRHKEGQQVFVKLHRGQGEAVPITDNGFIVVHPGDLKIDGFTKIANDQTLTELPADIANEVIALRAIAEKAGLP